MAERSGWVQPPKSSIFGEIGPRRNGVPDGNRVSGKIHKNIDFSKILGMALPGGQNVPTPRESILALSRGSQLPYTHFLAIFI